MTRKEWEDRAEHYEEKAAAALEEGDLTMHELYWLRAQAARAIAPYGTEPEESGGDE